MFASFMAISLTTICPLCVITGTFILSDCNITVYADWALRQLKLLFFILFAIIKRGALAFGS
jgi:hypothetical protein